MLFCGLTACQQNNIGFTCNPEAPRAGQSVQFANNSSVGEEWAWTFGDGSTSTIKSPTHTYKRPGSYTVVLKVDNKTAWTATHELTVYDTVPAIVASDTVFYIFEDYTFTANLYNPYYYDVAYEWAVQGVTLPDEGSSITCFFAQPNEEAEVRLRVILNGDTTHVRNVFKVQDKTTNAVYFRTPEGDFRQRIFGARAEEAQRHSAAADRLDKEQDVYQVYNGKEFTLDGLKELFPGIQGFHIASRKIYYRADGLWVANLDGSNPVQIDAEDCPAMTLDTDFDNRIYWANAQGVWYMPFVATDNNRFVTVPVQLNDQSGVTKIASDHND